MRSVKSTLKEIKGDASFRSFYRKKNNKKNSIIVYASKEKEKNLLIYDAINSLLIENKILAPKLYKENYKQNSIEIEDFGDDTIFKLLKKNGSNKINLYKKSVDLLSKIQKIKQNKIKNFNGKNYKIPVYDYNKLFKEAKLFSDYYTKKYISKKKLQNLMKYKKKLATIDTQDALIGNRAYDLASLIDDVRFKSNKKLKDRIYNYYAKLNNKKINKVTLLNDFEILSVLRNMKIIGIFTRLAVRDNKTKYLKLIPYSWKLIELRIKNNEIFHNLKSLLDLNFPKKIRNLK